MHLKWNNSFSKVLASSVALLSAATSLYAIPRGPCEPPPAPVCCEEPKPGPFAFSYPFDMNLACPRDFYFHVDGLAFQAKEDGMSFAIDDQTIGAGAYEFVNEPMTGGKVVGWTNDHRDWEYNYGLRVGAGFYLDHDAWNLDFNWTWVDISDYKTYSKTNELGVLLPLWGLGTGMPDNTATTGMFSSNLSAVWDGDYNTVDFRLGKPYHVSRYLVLNPHFGARGAWITQHFSVDYSGDTNPPGLPSNRWVHHGKNNFWGVGARAGVDTDWVFGKGFCLFGNLATSILYGKFDLSQQLTTPGTISNPDNDTANFGFDLTDDHYMNVPNFEIALGLGWGHYFDKNKYHVALRAAYEFHYWWDQLNLRRFYAAGPSYANDVVSRGDLSLSGFSLRLQFDM